MSRSGFSHSTFSGSSSSNNAPRSTAVASSSTPASTGDIYAPAYFAEQRRSELNELRNGLNEAVNKRNAYMTTHALERILAAMTIGMDVSELFNSVIMVPSFLLLGFSPSPLSFSFQASHTQDLVQKKMVYLFLRSDHRHPLFSHSHFLLVFSLT